MRLLRDIAVDLIREAMPRVPGPVQEVIDDVRDTTVHVGAIRYRLSQDGVDDLQQSYRSGAVRVRRVEQAVQAFRQGRRRRG